MSSKVELKPFPKVIVQSGGVTYYPSYEINVWRKEFMAWLLSERCSWVDAKADSRSDNEVEHMREIIKIYDKVLEALGEK